MILQLEGVSYLGVTELVSGRTEIQTQVCLILEHVFFTMVPPLVPPYRSAYESLENLLYFCFSFLRLMTVSLHPFFFI